MAPSSQKTLFLVGPGLIGSTLLVRLLATRPDLKLHALTRREEQASQLRSLGVEPIVGSLTDHDLIADWSRKSDIVIHAASADDDAATFAIVDGIQARPAGSPKVIYIQTSGNDELVHSAKGLAEKSIADKTISDTWTDEQLEKRIQPDAYHRHVDGPLRERLFNKQAEKKYNTVTSIMMPPLIYGIGAEPFKRISIQTPMLTRAMMKHGQVFTLPQGHKAVWNAVSVHDLVEAYLILLKDLEGITPGDSDTRRSHYVFPAEPQPFLWKEHFDAVVSQLQENNHPSAKNDVKVLQSPQEFEKIIKPLAGPYTPCFVSLVWGSENSYTKPDYLSNLGFKHQAKGVLHSITNDKELDTVINHGA